MKRMLVFGLLLTLFVALTACKQNNNSVPLILYNEQDPYILGFKEYIMEHAENRISIVSYDSQNSQVLQNELIDDILLDNPQLIIVNPVDRLGAYTIIDQAKEKDIPIIFINREPLPEDMNRYDKVYYIGAPAETGALIQVDMVVELFGNPFGMSNLDRNNDNTIQLLVLKGEQGHQDAEIRTEVVLEELEALGYDLDILSIEICDWQKQIAHDKMMEFLTQDPDASQLELVISNNDYMAIGAIDAMIELGVFHDVNDDGVMDPTIDDWIPVLGIDAIEEAIAYVRDGYLYGTVLNDSETMSIYLVDLVEALLNGVDLATLDFVLEDGKYIWVDYKKYEETE